MTSSSVKDYAWIYVKGMAMGAADIVPGVSGGTVAFITGIYEKLIDSIGAIGPGTLTTLVKQGPLAAWRSFNGNFLLTLMLGILTSVFTLSKLLSHLLQTQPELLWSFFFGLILISAVHIGRQIPCWTPATVVALVAGAAIAFVITLVSPQQLPLNAVTLFVAGSIAICAMVLPGISGSFILLLMGMYAHVIGAVKSLELVNLGIFATGCLVGLLLFTRLLSWLLHHLHNVTMAVLTGFMLGSLNKVWPWKQTLSTRINSHGETVPVEQANLLPHQYLELTGQDPKLVFSLVLMAVAVVLVLALERLGRAEPSPWAERS
ncbi:DUF368 domain-containing protein [Ketobacter sp.]|uniref:DUF368 domain-containing protein n=1 Tax=Ketobacter sp. TaxID=2083498 RepID=UPI000F2C97DB|nr:DUF368 domain-containing protein [Ketobacter sp.]RLT92622.1 MAG: DUF368 domain-containing protein [Ketobacter sp.]